MGLSAQFLSTMNSHPKSMNLTSEKIVTHLCAKKYSPATVVCSAAPMQQENCFMFAYTANPADPV